MVIWFNIKEARDFLLKNGMAYTLRPTSKRNGWVRKLGYKILSYYGFGQKGDVFI